MTNTFYYYFKVSFPLKAVKPTKMKCQNGRLFTSEEEKKIQYFM